MRQGYIELSGIIGVHFGAVKFCGIVFPAYDHDRF